MPVSEWLFYRGFLLSARPVAAPETFGEMSEGGLYFYHHQALDVVTARIAGSWLLLAGNAIDVVTGESDKKRIADRLVRSEHFFDEIDDLSGRFLIVRSVNGQVTVLHDAGGLNAVFYADGVVGSHAGLVAQIIGGKRARGPGYRYGHGHPGIRTPYEGVRLLTPNTLLEFPANRVHRYFPRENLDGIRVDQAADIVLAGMRTQMSVIGGAVVSLTAGIDSRLSLAASREHHRDCRFFTYVIPGTPAHEVDVSVATEIARVYGLHHQSVSQTVGGREYERFRNRAARNTYYRHGLWVVVLCARLFGRAVHLRSNLAEIGRAFYRKGGRPLPDIVSGREMANVYNWELAGNTLVRSMFDELHEETHFGNRFNYDGYDLFYWEHRMGAWLSQVVIESDLAFDTYILFNARRILKAMLAVPLTERIKASLFHEIIQRELPEISGIPINPKAWPS